MSDQPHTSEPTSDRERWNRRYRDRTFDPGSRPSAFLESQLPRIGSGLALDVAMGQGRNAVLLAESGFEVTGVDVSSVAIERARRRAQEHSVRIETVEADLSTWRPERSYDLIIDVFFLDRKLLAHLARALTPGGHLLVEHFSLDQPKVATFGPKDPAHLLGPNELLGLIGDLRVRHYEDRIVVLDEGTHRGKTAIVRMIAQRIP